MHRPSLLPTVAACILAVAAPGSADGPKPGDVRKVGAVRFATSCAPGTQADFDRAVALLHSFFYTEARELFLGIAKRDPSCAMAQWGVAMTMWHPIWTPPDDKEMKEGLAAIEAARKLGGKSELERDYIAALATFYTEPAGSAPATPGQTCHGPTSGTHRARAQGYALEMEKLHDAHPADIDAATFYALGLLGAADPTDKELVYQRKAAAILETFYAKETLREHPGLLHYLIHGYDYPPLAAKGVPAAERYAEVAPWVPHALHMPSHIFTRLGRWRDVIDSNLASADASSHYAAQHHPGAISFEELHALDYLAYAYLQLGKDAKAAEVATRIATVKRTFPESDFAASYAIGAVPARLALERRRWSDAAALTVPEAPWWAKFPFAEGHLVFARGLGAARSGKVDVAKAAAKRLEELAAAMTEPKQQYFAKQTNVQRQAVLGWIAHAEGKAADAEKILRAAADEDDALGKHPVSPGSMLPVREVYADWLLDADRPAEALAELEKNLGLNPGRLNALYAAGLAAKEAGKPDAARKHWGALLAQVEPDGEPRPEIAAAKAYLAEGTPRASAATR